MLWKMGGGGWADTPPLLCEGNQEWGNPSSGYLYGSGLCCRSASNETPPQLGLSELQLHVGRGRAGGG